ncbi:helix-turn-helix domain-containing protein [Bauldia litoralis]|uniref:helix-turn-helix domain-containing protein n=1 Tax=Bauldia litoralis TaxID=665467 RepID=UPI0032642724
MKAMRIGGKLRRLRQERHLTQAQMARELGISASYLTLLESNQRPVTVRVLLKLVERFQVDLQAFAADTDQRLSLELMEAFSDPIFEGAEVKTTDVQELVSLLPAVGRAMIDLYEAYRRHLPADATTSAGEDASETPPVSIPSEEVTEFIQKRLNHFPELEEAAEALWREDGLSIHTLQQDLMTVLRQRHGTEVEIRPADAMKGRSRRYDQLARRLQISEMLPPSSRLFQIAHQIAYLGHHPALDRIAASGNFSSSDAEALMRTALANYFASAVMMPYRMFTEAARATRYDIDILRNRFGVSFEQVCHRLTTLRRPGDEGVPFHFIRVDIAGNISKRFSASGIHIARFGAACPRWNVYDAFSTPGMLRVQISRMPDGGSFFCVARTTGRATALSPTSGLPHRVGQRAIGLGCDVRHAGEIVYADGLSVADPQIATPIGVSCRTCPRTDCAERAMPSLFQKLHIDENVRGPSTYVQA